MASTDRIASGCRIWLGRQRARLQLARRHLRNERILQAGRDVVNIRIHAPLAGLGAHLNMAVLMLSACEDRGVVPHFRFTSPLYGADDGSVDWLQNLYIQPRTSRRSAGPEIVITRWDDMSRSFRFRHTKERRALSRLVHAQFNPASAIAMRVESLAKRLFGGDPTLGIHYRGTDKAAEARVVPVSEMLEGAQELLATDAFRRIFVATDSADFVHALGHEKASIPVVTAPAVERSSGIEGIHFK